MISAGEIKRGMTIELDGVLYQIVEFQHIKLGRGSAQMRMKLRNVRKGDLVEKTFQANDRYQRARLDHRNVQFMYKDGTHYHFMDTATGATKPATVETGLRVNVPLFVERGDKIKVDTRTGDYLERA